MSRTLRAILPMGCLVVALSWVPSARADEIWVAPSFPASFNSTSFPWPVTGGGYAFLTFGVPDDMAAFDSANVVLLPEGTEAVAQTYQVFMEVKRDGDVVAVADWSIDNSSTTYSKDTLTGVDISAQLAAELAADSAGNDIVSLFFWFPSAPGSTDGRVLGLRFVYTSANQPQPGTVGSAEVADNSLTAADLATNSVGSAEIQDGSVGLADLALNSVGAGQIITNAVGAAEIATNAVTASEIAANAVGASEIAPNAVGASEIAAGAVGMSEANLVSGTGYTSGFLASGANYILPGSGFTPSVSGACFVTVTVYINTSTSDTYTGTFVRTARQVGAGSPSSDGHTGSYSLPVGAGRSTSVSVSARWTVSGGQTNHFGCYVAAGGDFVGNLAYCRTTYVCW